MEESELDFLADLIDDDDDDNDDENELVSLDAKEEHVSPRSNESQDKPDSKPKDQFSSEESCETANEDGKNVSKKLTEMENYIKFLESQLKAQNTEKSKSPEMNSQNANKENSSPNIEMSKNVTIRKISPNKMPVQNVKKECTSGSKEMFVAEAKQSSKDSGSVETKRIAHTPKSSGSASLKNGNWISSTKRKADGPAPQSSAAKRPAQDVNGVTDGFSGLRILNPLVSSTVMDRRMEGRKMIKISSIMSKLRNNDIEGDWVTIGVLIQKLPPKTSVKGSQYSIWKISDLAFHLDNPIISLFLFGETHEEHWKTSEGTVIALLNPSVLPSRDKQFNDVALTIDNPKKMMMMGVSQDFGRCQGARKADGAKCSNFVNKAFGDFCEYHVRREYSKMRSKRMECQQGYGAPSKLPRSKLKKKVGAENFFYQGRTVSTTVPPPRREKVTLKSLNSSDSSGSEHLNAWKAKQEEKTNSDASSTDKDGPSEYLVKLLKIPTVGSRNLMQQLHNDEEKELKDTRSVLSASAFLKANKVRSRTGTDSSPVSTRTSPETTSSKETSNPLSKTPLLGRGLNSSGDLIFDEYVPKILTKKTSAPLEKGKRQALALVRDIGPFTRKDPNDSRAKKPSPKVQDAIKSKLDSDDIQDKTLETDSKFTLADRFSLDSEEGRRILKAKSRYIGEVRQAELEQEEIYFKSREKKEAMEAKMLTIKELKVKVFQCTQCKYVAEKTAFICHEEKHKVKSLNVLKKFFACRDCKERTVTYGQRYPLRECRKCGSKSFEKCAMWKEKGGPKLGRDALLLRGPEYAKFLNSLESPKTNGILPRYL